ncbi:substrate-binding periplasmic protein [Hwanghaeella grinnelliae]|uniref:substrate-binding periplasmic protein n=1 Tax=Hwanghaeella grinnelliae TaxID=2500179 RepID=UPI001386E7AF|nr:transporter substrate-binding domain-containing protein [Hwanghaeella grinnelliae]
MSARISGPQISTALAPRTIGINTVIEQGRALALQALKSIGIEPVIVAPEPWKRVLKQLRNGKLDLVHTILKSDKRSKVYAYTVPWTRDIHGILVRAGRSFPYTSVADLEGKVGGTLLGARIPPPLNEIRRQGGQLFETSSPASLFEMLNAGRVDFVVGPLGVFRQLLHKSHDYRSKDFENLPGANVSLPVHMAFSRNSPCAAKLPQLNAALQKLSPIRSDQEILTQ